MSTATPPAGDRRPPMDVRSILRRGRRRHTELLVAHVVERGDEQPTRWAVVASRRVGNAVRRNRAKRLLRVGATALPRAGLDVVLVARAAMTNASSAEVRSDVEHVFDAPVRRAPAGATQEVDPRG